MNPSFVVYQAQPSSLDTLVLVGEIRVQAGLLTICILLREAEPAELKHKWQKWRWEEGQLLLKAGRRLKSRLKSLDLGSLSAARVQAARRRLDRCSSRTQSPGGCGCRNWWRPL